MPERCPLYVVCGWTHYDGSLEKHLRAYHPGYAVMVDAGCPSDWAIAQLAGENVSLEAWRTELRQMHYDQLGETL